jgi:hypothetical protein
MGKPFTNLSVALNFVDKDSLQGIKFNTSTQEIVEVVDRYAPLMTSERAEFIKQFVVRRYNHVQRLFS